MTWKRVATAPVLIPLAVGPVLWGSAALLAVAVALVTLLALFEYLALGEAIGHRAYRFWTATCALVLIYSQWQGNAEHGYVLGLVALERRLRGGPPSLDAAFFLFVLGIAILTLFTKRPMVEGLSSAGISASGLILIAFPLSFAIPLHAAGPQGPALLLFAMVIIWVGDTAAYFVGRSIGRYKLAPHLSPKKTWEGTVASFLGSVIVAVVFARFMTVPLEHLLGMAAVGNGAGAGVGFFGTVFKGRAGGEGLGGIFSWQGGGRWRVGAPLLAPLRSSCHLSFLFPPPP